MHRVVFAPHLSSILSMKLRASLLLLVFIAFIPAVSAESGTGEEITCEISISSKLNANNGFPAWLILKNISHKSIRICNYCYPKKSEWSGTAEFIFEPEFWKSDRPSLEDFSKHIITLHPGETLSLPFTLRGAPYTTIIAAYAVSESFAKKLGIWHGSTTTTITLPSRTSAK
jgi:hypothetical protein